MRKKSNKHNFFHYLVTVLVFLVKGIISEFIWLLVGLGGYFIFKAGITPYDIVIGLPLIAIGVSFIVHSILSTWLAVFSPIYNKGVCVMCNN